MKKEKISQERGGKLQVGPKPVRCLGDEGQADGAGGSSRLKGGGRERERGGKGEKKRMEKERKMGMKWKGRNGGSRGGARRKRGRGERGGKGEIEGVGEVGG